MREVKGSEENVAMAGKRGDRALRILPLTEISNRSSGSPGLSNKE